MMRERERERCGCKEAKKKEEVSFCFFFVFFFFVFPPNNNNKKIQLTHCCELIATVVIPPGPVGLPLPPHAPLLSLPAP